MLKHLVLILSSIFLSSANYVNNPGPRYPPTKGAIWPKPQDQISEANYFTVDPSNVKIKVTGETCEILAKAIDRYAFIVRNTYNLDHYRNQEMLYHGALNKDPLNKGRFKELKVDLKSPCEKYPFFGMEESYNLTVSKKANLVSNSIWGILRGLESWSQLFYITDDYNEVRINVTRITDFPRYSHRGLLIDTGRHYISLRNILKTLSAMEMNKMNVLHWHIVDDQSFPYESERFPKLSQKGAFHPSMVYTKKDIALIVQYATERGIRVLPEFDVPGHTRSWGEAFPRILTKCYTNGEVDSLGPMDPTANATYIVLRELIKEVQEWFPDKYFHVGGDEVQLDCWKSNPQLQEYMKEHKMTASDLHGMFMKNVMPLLGEKLKPIVWQEVYDEGVLLSKDTLIQVWKDVWVKEMITLVTNGYKVIFSSSWYLDHLNDGWETFYRADPREMVSALEDKACINNIVGGEACMWGEVVDDTNVISRVWPRASAVAERLWSPALNKTISFEQQLEKARHRLEEHVCRMRRRSIAAQPPNGPGFCVSPV